VFVCEVRLSMLTANVLKICAEMASLAEPFSARNKLSK
jgi:hypothetical protein